VGASVGESVGPWSVDRDVVVEKNKIMKKHENVFSKTKTKNEYLKI